MAASAKVVTTALYDRIEHAQLGVIAALRRLEVPAAVAVELTLAKQALESAYDRVKRADEAEDSV